MSCGEHRRSTRIVELEAKKPEKAVNKKKLEISFGTAEGQFSQRQRRKKPKVNHGSSIRATASDEAVAASSNTPLPPTSALELLLDILKRRDTLKIFAEPVNAAEVQGYDVVVKDPMDFGTISSKLSRGEYKMLEEFEHDVFLVFSNAMLFNDCRTVFYRQARTIRDVAKKLFMALRTNARNFEMDFSMARRATDRWTKSEARLINSNSLLESAGGRKSEGFVPGKTIYNPRASYPYDNMTSVSTVLNAPGSAKSLLPINQSSLGYGQNASRTDSVLKFTSGLGPVAQSMLDNGPLMRHNEPLHHESQAFNQQKVPWTAYPGSRMLSSVYQNPFGSTMRSSNQNPVRNHQQVPCTASTGSGKLPSVYENSLGNPARLFGQYPVHNHQQVPYTACPGREKLPSVYQNPQIPSAAYPGSAKLPSVHQNPFGSPGGAFDQYPVRDHHQAPSAASPESGKEPSVYMNPFGSPVRVHDHNANAQRDDFNFGSTSTSNGGNQSMFDGMSLDDFLTYLLNL
ncbi:hypothetical protein CDL15_Pgr016220 [Punica granatum]|uniref:Bromo domain-containing protein n=1 Tax=Punica granatum TaxID=22663 RepID=A0A218X187_PUNGR|nr:hypothetical protein CDL15_Pgr016220 [Punica granatum]